ncbi:MAG: EMC3/TMCO1 family protein [Candidatus Woesearchaeota archaeon]|jgi:uncharacterized membrane protein (DUF106 family)|nr:EMC3/TMCO1 family protein [Candidatus Woesearchaeota archaeon]MDP7506107.1 EMC3/TMCO1 family protein [Candidatus Woesearchaeota archaeon]MDP7610405.1 EMC3/TMCO1 family protein [Candidatus Woesearchaeota archaeon]|tara:strand:- start:1333 stop:2082 length:750 start_codon:yes stop_codon:yes gene_type:complete
MLEGLINPIFAPLLKLPMLLAIGIIAFLVSLIITLVYKFTTNQDLMKRLKTEMKEFQKEIKELKHDPEKAMEVNKKAMESNMKYMMQSMKSTLFTFLPIIIIFGWMNAYIAFEPILPGQEFTTTVLLDGNFKNGNIELIAPVDVEIMSDNPKTIEDGKAIWLLKGKAGEYLLEYNFQGKSYLKELLISSSQEYSKPLKKVNDGFVKSVSIDNKPMKVLNLFGWKVGWLGTYIIFSLIFSMTLRKIIKVY